MTLGIFQIDILSLSGGDLAAVENATVTVRKESDGLLATIYEDVDGNTGLANPFTSDGTDLVFYAHDTDHYSIQIVKDGFDRTLEDRSVSTRPLPDGDLATEDYVAALLGTAAGEDVGTAVGNVAQLEDVDGSPGLPAVDGSQLTGIAVGSESEVNRPIISNNTTDADHDLDISAGSRLAADGSGMLTLASALTKQIDASWAAGTDAGGLSSSLTVANDTWYHIFYIEVSGSIDVGFDTDPNAANLIADHGVTAYRYIGSRLTDGSANIIGCTQVGNHILWNTTIEDVNVTNPGNTAVTRTLSVPPVDGVIAKVMGRLYDSGTAGNAWGLLLTSLEVNDEAPTAYSSSSWNSDIDALAVSTSVTASSVVVKEVPTNGSSQIRSRLAGSTAAIRLNIRTLGWIDTRI